MNRKAAWVMITASQFAVAARAQEARALRLHEIGLVGHEDARRRIQLEELARDLREAVAGYHQHRLADQAEPLLLGTACASAVRR